MDSESPYGGLLLPSEQAATHRQATSLVYHLIILMAKRSTIYWSSTDAYDPVCRPLPIKSLFKVSKDRIA